MGKATRVEGPKPDHMAREKSMTTLPGSSPLISHRIRHNQKGPKVSHYEMLPRDGAYIYGIPP